MLCCLTFINKYDIIWKQKGERYVMIDKWIGISYYQFPSFVNDLERSLYEEWHDYLDDNNYVVNDNEEEECWD